MLHLTISDEWYKFEEKLEIKKKKKFRLAFNQRKENGKADSGTNMCCYLKLSQNGRIKVKLESIFLMARRL